MTDPTMAGIQDMADRTTAPTMDVQLTGDPAPLFKALSAFQSAVIGASKGGTNPHYQSNYSRLEDVWTAAREPLTKAGLSVTQWPVSAKAGVVRIVTILAHESGAYMVGTLDMPADAGGRTVGSQAVGSAITYACRYSMQAILGLPPVDDDGNASSGKEKARPEKEEKAEPEKPRNTKARIATVVSAVSDGTSTAKDELQGAIMAWLLPRIKWDAELSKRTADVLDLWREETGWKKGEERVDVFNLLAGDTNHDGWTACSEWCASNVFNHAPSEIFGKDVK